MSAAVAPAPVASPFDLRAATPAGGRFVALAERLADELAGPAAEHDRRGTYPHEGISALRAAGAFTAPIPEELGGLGVDSVHDLVVASSRLARGDASLAIGVNMHLVIVGNLARRHAVARAAGAARREDALAAALEEIVRDDVVIAAAISEPAQVLARPATRAERTPHGWRVDGRKIFCTMSPAATVLYAAVTCIDDRGRERYGYARIPADAAGVVMHDDWDALGMRGSGSQSVSFAGVQLPADAVTGGFPAGDDVGYMSRNLASGLYHASASLGIAEAADDTARAALRSRGADGRARDLIAESAVDLGAARATLAHAARRIDEHHAAHPADDGSRDDIVAVFAEAQAAKAFVHEAAVRIVDRSLTSSGGAGYVSGHPLSRAVRDVRAGMFMHPLGSVKAYGFLARVALGEDPALA